jgi:dephospho-CoA kinase
MNKPQLIGLAGTFAAGKDTVSHVLERDFGYMHVSTSEMVRKVAQERYDSIERPTLFQTANELRHENGPGALVIEALKHEKPLIISGLRSLGEAKQIKKAGGVLVFVDAPIEVRYERMRSRDRDAEAQLTLEQFTQNEQKEWHAGEDDADFNLRDIKAMSDHVIDSNQPLDDYIKATCYALGLK